MRHQKTPRVLSAILACAMLTTLLPMGALAADMNANTSAEESKPPFTVVAKGVEGDKTYDLEADVTTLLFGEGGILANDKRNTADGLKAVAEAKFGTMSAFDAREGYGLTPDVITTAWTYSKTGESSTFDPKGGTHTFNVAYTLDSEYNVKYDENTDTYKIEPDTKAHTIKVTPVTGKTSTLDPVTKTLKELAGYSLPESIVVTFDHNVKDGPYNITGWTENGTAVTDVKTLDAGTHTLVPTVSIPDWVTGLEKLELVLTVEEDKLTPTDISKLTPVVPATAKVGDTIKASLKDGEKDVTGLTWTWENIAGQANGDSYTVVAGDAGKIITVTAKGDDKASTGTSNPASIKVADKTEPTKLDGLKPVIKGTPKLDEVLTATLSGVEKGEPDIAWSWTVGGKPVNGNGDTLTVTGAMSNLEIKVQAAAIKDSTKYSGTSEESVAVKVEMMAISGNVAYSITDAQGQAATKVAVDYIITADVSNIAPVEAQDGLTYKWTVNGTDKATGKSYTVADGDKDIYVTATAGENFSGEVTSKEHLVVGKSLLTGELTIAPATDIKEGTKLTATLTTADTNATYDIFWSRGSEQIGDKAEYTVTKADLGQTLTVTAVGNGDYTGGLNAEVKIPAYAPDAPVATASAGNGAITLSWNTPADNGSAINGYTVYLDSNGANQADRQSADVDNTTHSYTFTGLTNGTAYTVWVTVSNGVGSTESQKLTATPVYSGGGGGGGGGGTSGGGGGNNSSGTTDKNVNTSGDTTTVTVNVKPTVSGDTASATLSDTTVNNAIDKAVKAASDEGTDAVLEINVSSGTSVDEVRATLSADAFKDIANSDIASVTISSDLGYLELDRDAIEAIAKQLGSGNVTLSLGKVDTSKELNERQQTVVGDAPVFDISIQSGSTVISKIGGELTVTLPYTLKSGEKADGVEVRYLDNNGNLESMPTTYNSRTGLVTFTTTHLSLYAIAYDEAASWENPFNDVRQSDWYFDAVRYASMNGLFNGTSASMFSPNASMTRSMLVTVLWRYAGEPAASGSSFSDVPAGQWYTTAVAWASANGIVSGIGEGKFAPNANVTREQIASILYRYAQSAGIVVSDSVGSGTFADQSSVSSWAVSGMNWAVKAGIISGRDGNRLAPSATASRAEVATMLQRFAVAAK